MKKLILYITFILSSSCSLVDEKKSFDTKTFFSNDMSFEDFKIKLDEYAENSHYPNIDNLNE